MLCSYFPSNYPRYSCIVFVVSLHGSGCASSGTIAGDGVRRIVEKIYTLSDPILLDAIMPYPASEWLKHLNSAGEGRKCAGNFVKTYEILEVRPEGSDKITSDQLVVP